MQDVLSKILLVRWALFPWQITSRPTVTVCYYSETNTSQQLHKLHTVNNVPLFNNVTLKSDLSSSKLIFQEYQRLWLNNQLLKDTPNTTPQQFLTKISATCVILELSDFRSKSLQHNRTALRDIKHLPVSGSYHLGLFTSENHHLSHQVAPLRKKETQYWPCTSSSLLLKTLHWQIITLAC